MKFKPLSNKLVDGKQHRMGGTIYTYLQTKVGDKYIKDAQDTIIEDALGKTGK